MKGRCLLLLSIVWLTWSVAGLRAEVRTWTDNSGKFKTQAEYISYAEGKVTLRKNDGQEVRLPLTRLSRADQRYVQERVREMRAKEKAEKEQAEEDAAESADEDTQDEVADEEETGDEPSPTSSRNPPPRTPAAREVEEPDEELRKEDLEKKDPDEEIDPELEEEDRAPAAQTARTAQPAPAVRPQPPAPPVKANNILNSVRGAVYRTQTLNNLRQISLALVNYASTKDAYPAASTARRPDQGGLSWRVAILPYMDEDVLYRRFRQDEPWDSEHNRQLIPLMPKVFLSPGINAETTDGLTNYLALVGSNTVIAESGRGTRLQDIRDGTSKTIMVVEADDDRAVYWTQPADLPWDPEQPEAGLGQIWSGQFFAALADGSCRRIQLAVGSDTLRALFTRNGGEVVDLEE